MKSGSISPQACSGDVASSIRVRTASTNPRTRGVSRTYSSSASGGRASSKSHTGSADPNSDTPRPRLIRPGLDPAEDAHRSSTHDTQRGSEARSPHQPGPEPLMPDGSPGMSQLPSATRFPDQSRPQGQYPAVFAGTSRADDGTRTHDILHGKLARRRVRCECRQVRKSCNSTTSPPTAVRAVVLSPQLGRLLAAHQ